MNIDTTTKKNLVIRKATSADFASIHRFNHSIFAEEIPQHTPNAEGSLVDAQHSTNAYLIALLHSELVGMICYNHIRPFSLDKKVENLDQWLPPHNKLVEVRLLAVAQVRRKSGIAVALLKTLIHTLIQQGFDLAVVSAITTELKMYTNIGGVPFSKPVGKEGAWYQPMYFKIDHLNPLFTS